MAGDEYESLRALVQSCTQLRQEIERLTLERDEANRESERLRKEAWERRNEMKPTWVTSEHHEAFEKLREQLSSAQAERAHAVSALGEQSDKFRDERDEARREVCELLCSLPAPEERLVALPHELAKIRGWDCYAVNNDAPAA